MCVYGSTTVTSCNWSGYQTCNIIAHTISSPTTLSASIKECVLFSAVPNWVFSERARQRDQRKHAMRLFTFQLRKVNPISCTKAIAPLCVEQKVRTNALRLVQQAHLC